jgi:hypothetical protein
MNPQNNGQGARNEESAVISILAGSGAFPANFGTGDERCTGRYQTVMARDFDRAPKSRHSQRAGWGTWRAAVKNGKVPHSPAPRTRRPVEDDA